ncbi:hypothetical protein AQUCO_01400532v1 [Aquilegia coerulea]|uniref:Uncharacterized protein n=1 Tax=Aquilegia coerulea TaxID=218851 RepID=A0A2G5DX01_AQUCA|nr:hypothetical protein AQUCO_01400532v1 [Aquilegia coerulea]
MCVDGAPPNLNRHFKFNTEELVPKVFYHIRNKRLLQSLESVCVCEMSQSKLSKVSLGNMRFPYTEDDSLGKALCKIFSMKDYC